MRKHACVRVQHISIVLSQSFMHVVEGAYTVNFGYNDVPPGKKKRLLYAKCRYFRNAHIVALCMHVCMDAEFAVQVCSTYRYVT